MSTVTCGVRGKWVPYGSCGGDVRRAVSKVGSTRRVEVPRSLGFSPWEGRRFVMLEVMGDTFFTKVVVTPTSTDSDSVLVPVGLNPFDTES